MLLSSVKQLQLIYGSLIDFCASSEVSAELPANTEGSPAPCDMLLRGLRLLKFDGPASMRVSPDGWLNMSAAPLELVKFAQKFLVQEGHTHWYGSPTSLIIEVDD